jgi:hypothetical protein
VREIVKRETIETSIAISRLRLVCESASVWASGERLEEGGVVPSGQLFIDSSWHEEPGLRCAAVVLIARAQSPWPRTTRRPWLQGTEVGWCIRFKDADEMVLNDPS